jgi:hypothetical protein
MAATLSLLVGVAGARAQEWRTIDGTGNNPANPTFGSAGAQLLRHAPAGYGDGVSSPAGSARPSPRAISNALCRQFGTIGNPARASDLFWLWAQFVDHDIELTEAATPEESLPIAVPRGDPDFDIAGTGTETISFQRSAYDPATGTGPGNPRQQINQITAFIDASNVYGSDAARAAALRWERGRGRLRTAGWVRLPFNDAGLPNVGGTSPTLFLAGDVRANEHVGLSLMHTAFVREHNRLARVIRRSDRSLSDDEIFERARALVGAEMQAITYEEFLPVLLGPGTLAPYGGYDPTVNAGVANVFSTAAFRLIDTMLPPRLLRLQRGGQPFRRGPISLREAFLNPRLLYTSGHMENLWRGLASQVAQNVDLLVINDLRNGVTGPSGEEHLDVAALSIQRGRDHGLPDYNAARVAYGLTAAAGFADITSDVGLQQRLAALYGTVENVDAWVGGLAEDRLPGALVGELFLAVIKEQFERLRDGDRFWYENVFSGAQLAELRSTRLADVLARNFHLHEDFTSRAFIRQ